MNEAGCADGESVPVPDDFMAELMEPCEEVGGMPVMGGAVLKEGDPVVILEGPFEGLAGILQGQTGEERVLVAQNSRQRGFCGLSLYRLAPSR